MQFSYVLKYLVYPLILFAAFYFLYDASQDRYTYIFTGNAVRAPIKIQLGDSVVWKEKNFDDSFWNTQLPRAPYFAWMRIWIDLDDTQIKRNPIGLGLWSYTGSYDLFWDGNYIGSNGVPGLGKKEQAGQIDKIFRIPDSLFSEGRHLIALRASQQKAKSLSSKPYLIIENYDVQSTYLLILAAFIHIFTGVFFIVGIYYFFIYLKSYRQSVFLIFAIICLLLFAGSLIQFGKFYYKYPYPFHMVRKLLLDGLTMLMSFFLCAYFLFLYKIKNKGLLLSGGSLILIISFLATTGQAVNGKAYVFYTEGILISMALTLWAIAKGKKSSLSSLYSLIAPMALLFFLELYFFNLMVYISFFIFIVFNLYTLSAAIGTQKKENEQYLIESNRLKVELLKKNIQPHFIMNTLTSLISWVEDSPGVAVKFIEALAAEFRILVDIVEFDKIPIKKEVQLCESHLKVMSYRHEVNYSLKCIDIDPDLYIPPAVFLTLLENGITHNIQESAEVIFELQLTNTPKEWTYRFFSPSIELHIDAPVRDGTGMKYIKARLREVYGQSWSIESYQKRKGWEIKIIIFHKPD